MNDTSSFNYESEMKEYYKSDDIVEQYHDAFSEDGTWRHRVIARRERAAVRSLLRQVPHSTVLDLPTGTGKLAPVFGNSGSTVVACDISENMLGIAKSEYQRVGHSDIRFQVCDAEQISETLDETFDVAVCLRLLHRVPTETKRRILKGLGDVADYVIASTGVESAFHKLRRWVRKAVFSGDERGHCYESLAVTRDIFTDGFDILESKAVLPVLSQERVYLLQPNA